MCISYPSKYNVIGQPMMRWLLRSGENNRFASQNIDPVYRSVWETTVAVLADESLDGFRERERRLQHGLSTAAAPAVEWHWLLRRIGFFRRREWTALAGLLLFFGVPYYQQCCTVAAVVEVTPRWGRMLLYCRHVHAEIEGGRMRLENENSRDGKNT